jgi:glycosyltransferase involved in cell wall biosynthesis
MNVLVLSELFYPHGSGAELATFLYADALGKMGCEVAVITNKLIGEPDFSATDSFKIYRLPLIGQAKDTKYAILKRSDILITSFIRRMLKWSDVVYIPRFWFLGILSAKAYGKPVITHLHDYIPICPLSTCYDQSETHSCHCGTIRCSARCIYSFEKMRGRSIGETVASVALNLTVGRGLPRLVSLSDAVLCVSNVQRELIIEKEPSLRDKTHVLYNPVSKSADLDISGKDFGYFGGSSYIKGFYLLCKVLASRKSAGSERIRVRATKFNYLTTDLKRMLNELGLLTYGRLNREEFKDVYRHVQTVLVPSLWDEPWPYAVVESLMQRRLLVASNIGGIPEQVRGCNGAFLCEPGNGRQLSDTLELVNGFSGEQMNDLGIHNREVFLRRFNNDSSARKLITICEYLI